MKAVVLGLSLLAASAQAAVTYVNGATAANSNASALYMTAYNVGTYNNGILILTANDYGNPTTSVAWNGQNFTKLTSTPYVINQYLGQSVWYLVLGNTTGQASNVTVSTGIPNNNWTAILEQYSDVDQSTPFVTYAFGFQTNGASIVPSINVSSASNGLAAFLSYYRISTVTTATGYTNRHSADNGSVGAGKSYDLLPSGTTGVISPSWGLSGGPQYATILLAEIQAASAGTPTPTVTLTASPTLTHSPTLTRTPTATPTWTPTISQTWTRSPTPSATRTATPTHTRTRTPRTTASPTCDFTRTPTPRTYITAGRTTPSVTPTPNRYKTAGPCCGEIPEAAPLVVASLDCYFDPCLQP